MKRGLTCLLLAFSGITLAQQITITGKVVDHETKEALPFASVFISGKTIGVVSNARGEFDFHIPADMRNDILAVSMIGYKTFEAPVWSVENISTDSVVIELNVAPILLSEVVITDTIKAGEVLKIAISRIDQNYPMEPFILEGFYRDTKNLGGTYISLLEAAVKIYDDNYQEPRNKFKLRERVALQEVRRSLGYSSRFTAFFDKSNLLEDLLLNNNVRYRQFPEEDEFFKKLRFEKSTSYNNREVFVLASKSDFEMRVFVDKQTYGIVHLEYTNNHQEDLEKIRDLESRFAKIKRIIDFKFLEGKLYLNYLTVTSQVNWYDRATGKLKFEAELQQQLLINNIHPKSKLRIGLAQKMKNYGLQYQDQAYNQKFWDNYNVIKATPLDKKIISDLERTEPLEKQFRE